MTTLHTMLRAVFGPAKPKQYLSGKTTELGYKQSTARTFEVPSRTEIIFVDIEIFGRKDVQQQPIRTVPPA